MEDAVKLYQRYPRKVGRAAALREIRKSLTKESFELLWDAVDEFARVWEGASSEQKQRCPHPRTWFCQERYHDDREDWWAFRRRVDRDSKDHHDFGGLQDFSD